MARHTGIDVEGPAVAGGDKRSALGRSAPAVPWPTDGSGTLHERFEAIAAAVPTRVAVSEVVPGDGPGRSITYDALNARANTVAVELLHRLGTEADRVAVFGGNAIDHIANLIGIFKAGKIAVPLDEEAPEDRLGWMIEHSATTALVGTETSAAVHAEVVERHGLATIVTDDLSPVADNPAVEIGPHAISSIMYTSGSTGVPKGVIQEHGFLYLGQRGSAAFHGTTQDDHIAQLFSFAYAAAGTNTFGALTNGATLYPNDVSTHGFAQIPEWIVDNRITVMTMVPTLLRRFIVTLRKSQVFPSLRYVEVGAEPLLAVDIESFRAHFPNSLLVNRLAASECGGIAYYVMDGTEQLEPGSVPVGYAAGGKEIKLLDDNSREVDDGVAGEIVVHSTQLSGGYWANDELNATAFGVDETGRHVYRTGDAGVRRPDGMLVHLGRLDSRVKIRGYAVDIAEVERALLAADDVAEAAVVVTRGSSGDDALAAYVVRTASSKVVDEEALRSGLLEALPKYAVPSVIVELESLPLTERGKVDRRELQERPMPQRDAAGYVPPETALEKQVAALWGQILGVDDVGAEDDFFDLGGHSIQVYELLALIKRDLDAQLSPTSLLEQGTVRSQAQLIYSGAGRSEKAIVPFRESGSDRRFFCVHGRGGGIVFLRELTPHIDEAFDVYGIQPPFVEDADAEYLSIEEMAHSYIGEIRAIQPSGPYHLGGSCFGGLVAREMARMLVDDGEQVATLVMIDPPQPHYEDPTPKVWASNVLKRTLRRRRVAARRRRLEEHMGQRWSRTERLRMFHQKAADVYRPEPLAVQTIVLAASGTLKRQRIAWTVLSTGGIGVEEFPAIHEDMYSPENSVVMGRMMSDHLAQMDTTA